VNRPGEGRDTHLTGRRPQVEGLPVDEDVAREIETHIELRMKELVAAGWDPEAARTEAVRLFGDPERVGRDCRHITRQHDRRIRWRGLLAAVPQDLRFGLRLLRRSPLFTAVAVLTLALGIGANSAIFSVVSSVVLKPLPYHEPDRIVRVWPGQVFSKSLFEETRAGVASLMNLSAYETGAFTLVGDGDAEQVYGGIVTVNHFDLLGVRPLLGRLFLPEEAEPGAPSSVLLSYGLWQRRFGGDPGVLGRTVTIGGEGDTVRTIVGVMTRSHRSLDDAWQLWTPVRIDPANFPDYQGTASLSVMGRLRDDVTVEQASADVNRFAVAYQQEHSWMTEEAARASGVMVLQEELVGEAKTVMLLMLGAVGLVLLLTCVNLANILLARASGRTREMAVRASLGAPRSRLVGQLLTEGVLLGLAGGVLGILLALWFVPLLKANLPADTPRLAEIGINWSVLLFTAAVSLAAGLLSGLLPALRSSRTRVAATLQEGVRTVLSRRENLRLNRVLIGLEIAIATTLLIGAGLMVKSIGVIGRVDPGFDPRNVLTAHVNLPGHRYSDDAAVQAFYRETVERISALHGVREVGTTYLIHMTGAGMGMLYEVEGHPLPEGESLPRASIRIHDPGYLRALRVPLLQGDHFTPVIGGQTAPEIMVNRTFARLYWDEDEAVGRRIEMNGETWTIVGVLGDMQQRDLIRSIQPEVYISSDHYIVSSRYLVIRTEGDPHQFIPEVQAIVTSIDDQVPLSLIRTMEDRIALTTRETRLSTFLLSLFASVALLLGLIGVYGVVAYAAGQRRRELGIRLALGAMRPGLVGEMMKTSLIPVGLGALIGIGGAWAVSGLLSSLLYGVSAVDLSVYAGVALLLVLVSGAAGIVPAVRASRLDAMTVLRMEE
jgi:putative ABC transport system permease protein